MKSTVYLAPDVAPEIATLAAELARKGVAKSRATLIYAGRNNIYRLHPDICVKEFRVPGLLKGLWYGQKPSKARRAFDNALKLRSLGFSTPAPLALIECKDKGRLGRSYYVCRYVEGFSELRGIEKRADFQLIAMFLAKFMRRLHAAGIFMKDFTQGNILFRRCDDGSYEFTLVDINRMEFDVADRSKLMSNFGSTLDTREGQAVLVREYARLERDASRREALARELIAIYDATQKRLWRKRHIKEFIRGKKR